MPAMLTEPESGTDAPKSSRGRQLPDASALVDRMPAWFRTSRRSLLAVVALAIVFSFFARRPLWHTDLWGHLAYGRLIWQSQSLPAKEPFMPLAEGMPLVDTAWLSQLIGYAAHSFAEEPALQCLYAAAVTLCLCLLLWRIVRRTDSLAAGAVGVIAFLWMEWQALGIIRPQLAGLCCFVALLTVLTSRHRRRSDWFVVPAIMALWANLHGSFLVGPVLLGTLCLGRAIDVLRRTGRLRALFRDGRTRRLLLLTQLAAVAVLINPYGFGLYAEVFALASNPNLADLQEWGALTLRMKQGRAAFVVALPLIVVLRLSPRRISASESLLLIGFGAAALWSSRFLVWWAPLAAMSLALHGAAVLRHAVRRTGTGPFFARRRGSVASASREKWTSPRRSEPRSLWTVASLGLCWIAFGFSPLGMRLMHGIDSGIERAVSAETPLGAAEFLRKHPPRGQIFNSYEWGDYLVWAGPEKPGVFVTSHAHLVPRQVWLHYIQILTAADGWENLLARYGANTVVINRYPADQRDLLTRLRGSANWQVVYQDDRSVIFWKAN